MVGGSCIKVVVGYKRAFWLDQRTRKGGSEPHVASLGPAHNIFHSSAGGLPTSLLGEPRTSRNKPIDFIFICL